MRTIAIEEHFTTPLYEEHVQKGPFRNFFLSSRSEQLGHDIVDEHRDIGDGRIARMDASGVDLQVLSFGSPGAQGFDAQVAIPMARDANDRLFAAIRANPTRFAGFAALPTAAPEVAADELERAVSDLGFKGAMIHGHTGGEFLDAQKYWPIFERAERLGVPIYLHPTHPPSQPDEISGLVNETGRVEAKGAKAWEGSGRWATGSPAVTRSSPSTPAGWAWSTSPSTASALPGRSVMAIKTLRDEWLLDEEWKARFAAEGELWVGLGSHPNIVHAYSVEEFDGKPHILLELITGGDLRKRIGTPELDVATSLHLGVQFCLGMEHATRQGLRCHRDVKPGNLMIDEDGNLKITDFGLAVIRDELHAKAPASVPTAPSPSTT